MINELPHVTPYDTPWKCEDSEVLSETKILMSSRNSEEERSDGADLSTAGCDMGGPTPARNWSAVVVDLCEDRVFKRVSLLPLGAESSTFDVIRSVFQSG